MQPTCHNFVHGGAGGKSQDAPHIDEHASARADEEPTAVILRSLAPFRRGKRPSPMKKLDALTQFEANLVTSTHESSETFQTLLCDEALVVWV